MFIGIASKDGGLDGPKCPVQRQKRARMIDSSQQLLYISRTEAARVFPFRWARALEYIDCQHNKAGSTSGRFPTLRQTMQFDDIPFHLILPPIFAPLFDFFPLDFLVPLAAFASIPILTLAARLLHASHRSPR